MPDIELTGWDEFINKAGGLPRELREEFAGEVEDAANHWETLAKNAAPVDQGLLQQNIKAEFVSDLEWNITAGQEYAPFQEFGTKSKVNIPAGLEAYAAEFKGQGSKGGRFDLQKLLFAWMDRMGIPDDKQWLVYISIVVHGIKPHPFLFPQEAIIEPEFIGHLQNIVNTEH